MPPSFGAIAFEIPSFTSGLEVTEFREELKVSPTAFGLLRVELA
jgi:hypothetical protein